MMENKTQGMVPTIIFIEKVDFNTDDLFYFPKAVKVGEIIKLSAELFSGDARTSYIKHVGSSNFSAKAIVTNRYWTLQKGQTSILVLELEMLATVS